MTNEATKAHCEEIRVAVTAILRNVANLSRFFEQIDPYGDEEIEPLPWTSIESLLLEFEVLVRSIEALDVPQGCEQVRGLFLELADAQREIRKLAFSLYEHVPHGIDRLEEAYQTLAPRILESARRYAEAQERLDDELDRLQYGWDVTKPARMCPFRGAGDARLAICNAFLDQGIRKFQERDWQRQYCLAHYSRCRFFQEAKPKRRMIIREAKQTPREAEEALITWYHLRTNRMNEYHYGIYLPVYSTILSVWNEIECFEEAVPREPLKFHPLELRQFFDDLLHRVHGARALLFQFTPRDDKLENLEMALASHLTALERYILANINMLRTAKPPSEDKWEKMLDDLQKTEEDFRQRWREWSLVDLREELD
jgi:hypothetical protein